MWNIIFGVGAAILAGLLIAAFLSDWVRREFANFLRATGLQKTFIMDVLVVLDRAQATMANHVKAFLITRVQNDENWYQVSETEMHENDVNDDRVKEELRRREQVAVDVKELVMST
jgi:hypothetical protein